MQPNEGQKPSLKDVLSQAKNEGETKRQQGAESGRNLITRLRSEARSIINSARDRAEVARDNIQVTGRSIAEVSKSIIDISIGFASNSEARSALRIFMKEKATNTRDAVDAKAYDIRENAFNKAEAVVMASQNRMHEAVQNAQNNFRSDVAEAQNFARGVQNGGREVVNFFRRQGEKAVSNARANTYDSIADFRKLQALPDRAIGSVLGKIASFFQERTNDRREKVDHRNNQATRLRQAANNLRMGPAAAGA